MMKYEEALRRARVFIMGQVSAHDIHDWASVFETLRDALRWRPMTELPAQGQICVVVPTSTCQPCIREWDEDTEMFLAQDGEGWGDIDAAEVWVWMPVPELPAPEPAITKDQVTDVLTRMKQALREDEP